MIVVLTQEEANELLALASNLPVGATIGQYMAMLTQIQRILTTHLQEHSIGATNAD